MNQEFIIDGTNLIERLSLNSSFVPLIQILLTLEEKGLPFFCYFDADTRYKLKEDREKQLYQNLIKFGLPDYFIQVSGLDADEAIVKQAAVTEAIIISTDTFTNFKHDFGFLNDDLRIAKPVIDNEKIRLDVAGLNDFLNKDLEGQLAKLVDSLENERGRLHGVIDKYKEERAFGFIKRPMAEQKLFFKKENISDENLNYTRIGEEVSFSIGIGETGGIYYFCGVDIRQRATPAPAEIVEHLNDENKMLKESKNYLQKQNAEVKVKLETQLHDISTVNKELKDETLSLREQLALYKSTDNEVIRHLENQKEELIAENDGLSEEIKMLNEVLLQKDRELEGLKAEIDHLRTLHEESNSHLQERKQESNELSLTVDVQHEKIKNLDDDLRSTLRLIEVQDLEEAESMKFEQLKKDYKVLQKVVHQKNSRILFLSNSISDLERQLAYNTSEVVGQGVQVEHLLERIQELERTNLDLMRRVEEISTKRKTPGRRTAQQEELLEEGENTVVVDSKPTKLDLKPAKPVIKKIPNEELEDWWNNLEEQWKKAFNQGVLSRGEVLTRPTFEQLQSLFERKKVDIVGSGILLFGLNQLSFKLNNLSGIKDLKQITELNLSGHEFTELEGITELPYLELLNCTSNNISTLRNLKKLKSLKTLIIRDNDLSNLDGIEELEELEYINALYNRGLKTISGVEVLEHLQVLCVPNFKTRIIKQLDKILKQNPDLEVRNV